jgi:hypothetical protein
MHYFIGLMLCDLKFTGFSSISRRNVRYRMRPAVPGSSQAHVSAVDAYKSCKFEIARHEADKVMHNARWDLQGSRCDHNFFDAAGSHYGSS